MALKPLNSVGGFSVGEIPANVILANADIISNNLTVQKIANLGPVGNVKISGGANGQYLQTDGTGNLTWTTANTSTLFNGTSNVSIPVADGNVNTSVNGNANVFVVTGTGANVTGYFTASGNITGANANLGNLVTANYANLAANLIANNVSVNLELQANTANFDGNVVMDQWLSVSNTANVGNLRTDNLLYANGQPWDLQEAAGSNTQLQYNDGLNNFGASANLTFDYATNVLKVTGNANVTDTALVGNLRTDNLLYANGQPWDLQEAAGSNTQIQYNDGLNNFGASANFTYDDATQQFTLLGNANITQTAKIYEEQLTSLTSTQVVYGNGSSFLVGSANFTFNDATNLLNVNGNANFAGNSIAISNNFITANGAGLGLKDDTTGVQIEWNASSFVFVDGNGVGLEANTFIANLDNSGNFSLPNNLSVVGNISNANNITTTNDLTVGGNANVTGNVAANNISITGSGNITGANVVSANTFIGDNVKANSLLDTQIVYANSGNYLVGNNNFVWNNGSQTLGITGNANVSGTVNTANINSGGSDLTLTANGQTATFAAADGNFNFPGNVIAGTFYGNVNANITVTAANTSVLYSDSGLISGATGFTFDKVSNLFSLPGDLYAVGNANIDGTANINTVYIQNGNISGGANSLQMYSTDYVQLNYNNDVYVYAQNDGVWLETTGGGNVHLGTDGNVSMSGNLSVTGNIANANNISVTYELAANTGNFSGNITSLNANLGNLADANYVRTQQLFNGSANIDIINSGNIAFSPTVGNVMVVSSVGANVIGYVQANGTGSFGAVEAISITSNVGNLLVQSEQSGNSYIQLRPYGTGTVDVGNTRITSLAEPNASTDAATKLYVDTVAQGLDVKDSVHAASYAPIANNYTYNNGTGGVGATLTANQNGILQLDGQTILLGERVLIKDEVGAYVNNTTPSAAFNGIYVCTTEGTAGAAWVLTRAVDFDVAAEMYGAFTFIETGTNLADTGWVCTNNVVNPITVGTTQILWSQFSGAGTYSAGAGLTLTGTVFSVNVDNNTTEISGGNVVVKAGANLTTPNIGAATGTSLDLTGNLLAGNVNSNAKVTAANVEVTGNVLANYINANANLLVNNATVNLELSGNTANFIGNVVLPNLHVNVNLDGNIGNFTGNVDAANFNTAGVANVGNLLVANYVTSNLVPNANLTYNVGSSSNRWADVFTGNVDASGNIVAAANITANNFISNTVVANNKVDVGTTQIIYGNVTTSAITANQTIATVSITGVTGVEWLVKGYDSSGAKYSMAIVTAVTDGTDADYSTFGTVNLGGTTGTLAVNVSGSNLELQVTPASTNTTVWVTQFRTI